MVNLSNWRKADILSIQIKSILGNKQANIEKVEKLLAKYASQQLDLVVLPEFFATNTQYQSSPEDEDGGETIAKICNIAKQYNTNIIAGSVVRNVSGRLYNSSFAINRNGCVVTIYDKIHLFAYLGGSEHQRITNGEKVVVADFDFARVGMSICFDIRFPMHYHRLMQAGAEILVLPTAWIIPDADYNDPQRLSEEQERWIQLNRIRAFDNEAFVVVSGQTQQAGNGFGGIGCSIIVSPQGRVLQMITNDEGAIYSEINVSEVELLRNRFPIHKID